MFLRIVAILIAMATLGSAAAHAERAFTMADVNLRTGPDVGFPSVDVIPEGEPILIVGCLRDESWCDISWDGGRGWVFSEYLAVDDDGQMVPLLDVGLVEYRIPYITFVAADYWDRYYVGRPWYSDRDRWLSYRIRPRSGWHAPPSGPRRPGWWRSGYHAPRGMRPPPDRGWRRTERHERDRRDTTHRDHNGDDRDRGEYTRRSGETRIDSGREGEDHDRDGRRGRADARGDPDRDRSDRERGNRDEGDKGQHRGDAEGRDRGADRAERGADRGDRERERGGKGRGDRRGG